jgi:hypothetical protein
VDELGAIERRLGARSSKHSDPSLRGRCGSLGADHPLRVGQPTKTPGSRGAMSYPRRGDVLDRGTRQRTESVWRPARVIVCHFFL